MVMWNMGRPWAEQTRRYAQDSLRPISATVIAETEKALLLKSANRTVWVPRRWVKPNPDRAVFWIPSRVCQEKLLD